MMLDQQKKRLTLVPIFGADGLLSSSAVPPTADADFAAQLGPDLVKELFDRAEDKMTDADLQHRQSMFFRSRAAGKWTRAEENG